MSFEDLTLWLVTAMSVTAVVFLLWTLAALVLRSGSAPFAMESEPGGVSADARRARRG